jgi:beta-phosphoglucomutase
MRKLEAFIFDLDGVITDTAEYHYLAWKELAGELGIPFTREDNERLKGVSRLDSLEIILEIGSKQQAFTQEEKEFIAKKKNTHYVDLIKQITPNDILPGIKTLLEDIKRAGIKIGLASASKNARAVLKGLNLLEEFDYMADANLIAHGKPDPEIFLDVAENLKVKPENCIGIEDAKAGVQAIKRANMFAIGIGSTDLLREADIIYASTSELSFKKLTKEFC